MYFARFANHVGDPPPPHCKLLVYQDRRHLFVTPFYQLRVWERKFAVVVYRCNWKNAPKLYTLNRLLVLQKPALVAQCVKELLPRLSNWEVVGSSPGCDPCSIRK